MTNRHKNPISISNILLALTGLSYTYCSTLAADTTSLLVQSTTSTANSGLYDHLLPEFEKNQDIKVHVVAVGTGQAIKNARNCDADVLLVHAKSAEQQFVDEGFGIKRFDLMYNDFVIVGPATDPASVAGSGDVIDALQKVAASNSLFASRGDDSGTHKKEQALWQNSGIDVDAVSGQWYRSTGSGMGATLNTAIGMGAYTLTDRATWISFKNKSDFKLLVQGDEQLYNQYGVIMVNPERCPNVNFEGGQRLIDWLLSGSGQAAIASFSINDQQLFYPNAQ